MSRKQQAVLGVCDQEQGVIKLRFRLGLRVYPRRGAGQRARRIHEACLVPSPLVLLGADAAILEVVAGRRPHLPGGKSLCINSQTRPLHANEGN